MNSLSKHILEVAEESGEDYAVDVTSSKSKRKYKANGRQYVIESWYNEGGCKWEAFCVGFGTYSSLASRLIKSNLFPNQ